MVIEDARELDRLPVDTIHRSKITTPPVTGISRPHLVARIEQGVQGKLTVVSAPAGWGKSTLLAEWASRTGRPVAWVSLDEGDNDPTRYFRALVAALDHIAPLQLDDIFTMLRTPTPAVNASIDSALLSRLEDFPDGTVIVLDDFHALTNPDQLRSFGRVLEQLPPAVHIVIAARGDIQIALARLRATGAVTVLRAEDMAFSVPEVRAMLAAGDGVVPSDADLDLLVQRTEGWIAGLRLATLSPGRQPDPHRAFDRLRGTHRDIADYFREEILDRLDPGLRRFLVETSVLDTFSESLANAVGQRRNARALLDKIEAADLFLVPLDDERLWYRYHALFRDMLLADFSRLPDEQQAELHSRASDWFENNAMINEAVEHALAFGEVNRAAGLVDRYGDALMFHCGETSAIVGWIEQIPDEVLKARPGLLRVYAWALTTIGRIDQAGQVMERVCALPSPGPDVPGSAEREAQLAAVRARIAAYRGDNHATVVHGRRALELLDPVRDGRVMSDVVLSIGFAERALGNIDTAADRFAEAARLGRQFGNTQGAHWGVRYLALARVAQGRLREAEAIIDEGLERERHATSEPGGTLSALLVGKAEILFHRNRLAEARSALDQAIPLIQRRGDAKMLMNAYIALSMIYQAEGNDDAALEKVRRSGEVFPVVYRGAHGARLAMAQGRHVEAGRWARFSGYSLDDAADPSRGEFEQQVYARIMATIEPGPAAIGLVERLCAEAEAAGRHGQVIELLIMHALATARVGNDDRARASLARALQLARPEGYLRVFLDEGPEMRGLLRDLVRDRSALDDTARAFALELIGTSGPEEAAAPSALDEPLTSRQLEILRLMAAGLSNRDIAGHLYIAEGTVKAHVHQIFGKLMARSRTEAVANARELHLLA